MKNSSKRFYGVYSQFNPKLILLQITCLQLVFYLGLSFYYLLFDFSFGLRLHLGQYFHHTAFNTDNSYGVITIVSNILNMPIVIIGLLYIVVKANKVLDFISTMYLIHFLICIFYNGIKFFNLGYFVVNFICFLITVLVGEYVLIKFEQKEIKLFDNIIKLATNTKKNANLQTITVNPDNSYTELKEISNNNEKIEIKGDEAV